jgi:8-oxo-dGTP pyrophosphatase MutT (NUDIX family)
MKKKKEKEQSAGFIIVRRQKLSWKVLGLRVWGKIDIPKGHLEEGEGTLDAAVRECFEEAGIRVSSQDMKWGQSSFVLSRPHKDVTVYIAETDQEPVIQMNPETKQYEHDGYHWLTWDDMQSRCYPYLRDAVNWAQEIVEGT